MVFVGLSVLAVCAMFLALQPAPKKFRVGIFDSRGVALAYARSGLYAPVMRDLKAKYEKAKAENDEKTIKQCEAEGPARHQVQMQQVFSVASVADIFEAVKADLPNVAREAGVDIIVSKWEVVHKDPSIARRRHGQLSECQARRGDAQDARGHRQAASGVLIRTPDESRKVTARPRPRLTSDPSDLWIRSPTIYPVSAAI